MLLSFLLNAGSFIGGNVKLILGVLVTLAITFFVVGFFHLRNELASTEAELTLAQAQVSQLQKDVSDVTQAHNDLLDEEQKLQQDKDNLLAKLNRPGQPSLSEVASKDATGAKKVEQAINDGTVQMFNCIEAVTNGKDCP